MKKVLLLIAGLTLLFCKNQAQVVTDYDGNAYDTVIIGTQVWLKENLRVTHYNNGDLIPNITDNTVWAATVTGARCYFNNDSSSYDPFYGVLYNWYAVSDTRHLCPAGWHVSGNAEWQMAENYLGGVTVAGGKMKEEGTAHWKSPNTGATNSSRFTGLPGGMRDPVNNIFTALNENGLWWTSSIYGQYAWSAYLYYLNTGVDHNPTPKKYGLSVRCIQDINTGSDSNGSSYGFRVYPNPTKDMVFIEAGKLTCDSRIEMVNADGQVVSEQKIIRQQTSINLRGFPDGMYILRFIDNDKVDVRKILKQ